MLSKTFPCILLILFIVLYSCRFSPEKKNDDKQANVHHMGTTKVHQQVIDTLSTDYQQRLPKLPDTSAIEKELIKAGLVNIQTVDSSIQVDVRYATKNNFTGKVLYPNYHKVYLQKVVAKRLRKAQHFLKMVDSNYTLLVFDGARPQSIQQKMWNAMDSIPVRKRIHFLSNPVHGSIHNYGCAVDLTIKDIQTGELLDMGAHFDDLRKIAYPRYEQHFLQLGKLTQHEIDNRKLLRKVMHAGHFWVIQTEWWHFNAFSRKKAKELYPIIP